MRHIRFALALASILVLPGWTPAMADAPKTEPAPKQERCPAPTGSRISPERDARGECPRVAGAGQVFEKEDLERTGQIDLGAALQQLSPSISQGL